MLTYIIVSKCYIVIKKYNVYVLIKYIKINKLYKPENIFKKIYSIPDNRSIGESGGPARSFT